MKDVKEIGSMIFGIYSPKEIIDISACKIDNNKLSGRGSVYDERMGPSLDSNLPCVTCSKSPKDCPGHFGYIELNEPIINPLFYKHVVAYLRCICIKCNRLLITKDQLALNGILRYKRERRFKRILDKLEKVDVCCRCSHPQPTISYSVADNTISMVYKEKIDTKDIDENENKKKSGNFNKISISLGVNDIKKIFESFPDEDVALCGFDPERIHPLNLILTMFPVIPPCFTKGTIVYTNNGYKYIEDVLDEDKLYTHTGKFEKINEKHITKYTNKKMIEIDVVYHPHKIKCTPEHPFYVRDIVISRNKGYKTKMVGEPKWVAASDLTNNSFIGMKRNTNNIIPSFSINKKGVKIDKILDNDTEWFLFGYFTGDGWLDFSHVGRFYLVYHIRDEELILNIMSSLGITFRYKKHGDSIKCKTLECHNFIYWNILKSFGHLAHNKKIPQWVHDSPIQYVKEYINGYCKADGHVHKKNQLQFTTVSKDIAFSIQLLFLKMGKVCDINYVKGGNSIINGIKISGRNRYNLSCVEERKYDLNIYLLEKDYIWYKVSNKEDVIYMDDITVYNFDVGKDHTYCVENMIVHNCARPFVVADGNICDDDLTNQLLEIIKANNALKDDDQSEKKNFQEKKEVKRQKALQSLKFRIATLQNNSQGKAKHPTNGRAIKCLKNRITGKDGLLRSNLMGKRVNFSARTVIGPDPTLPFGWMGMPKEVAQELTIPERVTIFNKEYLTEVVNSGKANFIMTNNGETRLNLKYAMFRRGTELLYGDIVIRDGKETKVVNNNIDLRENDQLIRSDFLKIGDIIVRGRKGAEKRIKVNSVKTPLSVGDKIERINSNGEYEVVCYISIPKKKRINLNIGDIVHRHIKDGDIVLLNRQPTLHKGSMLAKKVRVMPHKTFRMNLATTKTFNADFDIQCGFLK